MRRLPGRMHDDGVITGDTPPLGNGASQLPDAVGALRCAVAAAEAEHGGDDPRTAELRARLTCALIEFGRDAEAAALAAGTLRAVTEGEIDPYDCR